MQNEFERKKQEILTTQSASIVEGGSERNWTC